MVQEQVNNMVATGKDSGDALQAMKKVFALHELNHDLLFTFM